MEHVIPSSGIAALPASIRLAISSRRDAGSRIRESIQAYAEQR
jgi:hypothetical protein